MEALGILYYLHYLMNSKKKPPIQEREQNGGFGCRPEMVLSPNLPESATTESS